MKHASFLTLVFGVIVTVCDYLRTLIRYVYLTSFIPGPSLWEFATVYVWKFLSGDTTKEALLTLAEKSNFKPYGMWSKKGHFVIVVCDCESVHQVFKYMKNKAVIPYQTMTMYLGDGLITLNGPQFKRHRKLLTPAFRKPTLESHLPRVNEEVLKLIEEINGQIQDKPSEDGIDIEYLVQTKAIAVSFSVLTSYKAHGYELKLCVEAMKMMAELMRTHALNPFWMLIKRGPSLRQKLSLVSMGLGVLKSRMVSQRTTALKRLRDGEEASNIAECMAETSGDNGFTDEEFFSEIRQIMGASAETMGFAETVCLYLLALHPDVQERLFEEIETVFGGGDREVDADDLSKMAYLDMVIKEAMRLFPPVPFSVRRVDEEMNFRGMLLPKDCTVLIDLVSLHRNPEHFPDPLKFDPERFHVERSADRHAFAYVPFSYGSRGCPGQVYAMLSLKTFVSRILKNFKIYPTEGLKSIDDIKCSINITCNVNDIPLRFVPRNNNLDVQ